MRKHSRCERFYRDGRPDITQSRALGLVSESRQAEYLRLNGKYLKEARALLSKGDYAQASEKFWGAAAEIIKAVAATRGRALGTHRSVGEFLDILDVEHPEWNLQDAFAHANSLHMNFYEDHLTPRAVKRGAEAVEDLVAKLRRLV